jgi:hypothetical protein
MQFVNGNEHRNLQTAISEANLKAQIELFLRNFKKLRDNEDVVSLEIGELKDGVYPINIQYIKEQEVKVINHNGKS